MVRQAHHERNKKVTVRPEPVEGSLSKDLFRVSLVEVPLSADVESAEIELGIVIDRLPGMDRFAALRHLRDNLA
jgi:hypothetical protein